MGMFSDRDRYYDEVDERGVKCSCGHLELPEYVECGMCGDCADEAVDRVQQRQIERFDEV